MFLLKLSGSLALLAYVASHIDWPHVSVLLAQVNPLYIVLNVLLIALSTTLMSMRWYEICQYFCIEVSRTFTLKNMWISTFFNQVLPGGVGGDAVRVLALKDHLRTGGISSVLIDRGIGMLMIFINVLVLLPISYLLLGHTAIFPLFPLLGMTGVSIGLGFVLWGDKLPLHHIPHLGRWLKSIPAAVRHVLLYPSPRQWRVVGLSLAIQALGIAHFYVAALALGLNPSLWACAALVPPVYLLVIIPLSLAGWGLREGAVVSLFTLAGQMNATEAATMSVLYGLCMVATSLPGAVVLVMSKTKKTA